MAYIIVGVFVILLAIVFTFYTIKTQFYKDIQIYKNKLDKETQKLLSEAQASQEHAREQIEKDIKLLTAHREALEKSKQENLIAINEEIQDYRRRNYEDAQNALLKNQREKQEEWSAIVLEYQHKQSKLNVELRLIQEQIDDLSAKRDAANEAMLKEKEIREQQDFYRVILSNDDLSDIELLMTIEPRLRKKEALQKLIYDVFYRIPASVMINRTVPNDTSGIYKITNLKTTECYIGKSVNIRNRWTEHIKTALDIGTIARTRIHEAMKQYGIHNFTFEVLEEVEKSKLNEREKFYIDLYQSNKFGYNMKAGG